MNKKILIASICGILSCGAFASNERPNRPERQGIEMGENPMMQNLTEDEKTCINSYGCEQPSRPEMTEGQRPEQPSRPEMTEGQRPEQRQRPEMSEEQKNAMTCMQEAMKNCGIEFQEPQGRSNN